MNLKILQHIFLFLASSSLILFSQVHNLNSKFFILITIPLFFLILHLKYFSKDFLKEIVFITISFLMTFTCESFISNTNIYYFGIVNFPQYRWPPPWIISLWIMFPAFLCTSLNVLNKTHSILGAYLGAFLLYLIYAFGAKHLDLIFFHNLNIQSALLPILSWYLLIRGLFKLNHKIYH